MNHVTLLVALTVFTAPGFGDRPTAQTVVGKVKPGELAAALPAVVQSARDFGCTEWHHCRQLALAAADRGDYETFHDLAWRAVQTGPPRDPALMYLLARAQAVSGRPHDALITQRSPRLLSISIAAMSRNPAESARTKSTAWFAPSPATISLRPNRSPKRNRRETAS